MKGMSAVLWFSDRKRRERKKSKNRQATKYKFIREEKKGNENV